MAGIGSATYAVAVEFGLKNRMTQGVRSVQAQMRGIQAQVNAAGKQTAEHLKRIQSQAARYGTIYGNPKSYAEAKRNLDAIHQQQARLRNQMTIVESQGRRAAMSDQAKALQMTERDVRAKAQSLKLAESAAAVQLRSNVAQERSRYRMVMAENRERKEAERAFSRRQNMYRNIGSGAFKAAEYSGIGALGIGGGLFEAWKAAANQQQLATTTAMVMGYKGGAQGIAANALFRSELKNSMAVGLLSSADIAAIQTQLAMHVPGLGMKNLLALTPLVSKFADVMKMTKIPGAEDPAQSAAVAAMIANVFNARYPAQMRKILEQFFVMEQSTGADVQTSVNAISQYGALGKSLGFSARDMIDLYGAMFRMGAGKGKVGARLGTLLTRIGSIPTSVMRAWGSSQLGLVDHSGVPNILKQAGGPSFDAYLKLLAREYQASIHRYGMAAGKARFLTAMTATYGATGEKVLFPLIQSGSIQNYEAQIKRRQQFSTIEQAQATFFNLPINQWKRAMTNFQTLIIAFGGADVNSFAKVFSYWANQFEQWTNWIQSHPGKTKRMFDDLLRLAEVLAVFSAISGGIGAISKGVEAYMAVSKGIGLLSKAMGKAGAIESGASDLAGAFSARGAAGLIISRLATISGALLPIAATLAFLKGLQANAKMGTRGINPNVLRGVYGNNYAFPGSYNLTTGEAIQAPPSTPVVIHNHLHIDGKEVGRSKSVASGILGQMNRSTRHGIHSTTTGQGTVYQSPYETLNAALHPNVY